MQIRPLLAVLACALPLAAHAAELAIPELGIHFSDLPVGVASPKVKARVDGYTATLRMSTAMLRIDRMEETLPSGSDIRNASFRATQEAGFGEHPFSKGQPTAVNGRDAWTTMSAIRSPEGSVRYSSSTYVVVDQHLYRFLASCWWKGDGPPPDFVEAVKTLSNVTFEPVDRSATSNGGPPSGLVKMPYFFPSSKDYYPDVAKRRGETGVVDLEFSIDGTGRARDVQEIYAATHDLGASARLMLSETQFHLSPGWEDKGYQKLRFTFEVHYSLARRGARCEELPTRVPDAQLALICGSAF
jgi:TonB family protein